MNSIISALLMLLFSWVGFNQPRAISFAIPTSVERPVTTTSQAFAGVTGASASPPVATSPNDNWNTYTNPQYRFSLQYPGTTSPSFVDHVVPSGDDIVLPCNGAQAATSSCLIFIAKDGYMGKSTEWGFPFFVFQHPMNNLEIYVRNSGRPDGFAILAINGRVAYQVHFGTDPGGLTEVYIQNSAHLFLFYYPDVDEETAHAILSTLQLY